jgi:hypothetical protein
MTAFPYPSTGSNAGQTIQPPPRGHTPTPQQHPSNPAVRQHSGESHSLSPSPVAQSLATQAAYSPSPTNGNPHHGPHPPHQPMPPQPIGRPVPKAMPANSMQQAAGIANQQPSDSHPGHSAPRTSLPQNNPPPQGRGSQAGIPEGSKASRFTVTSVTNAPPYVQCPAAIEQVWI